MSPHTFRVFHENSGPLLPCLQFDIDGGLVPDDLVHLLLCLISLAGGILQCPRLLAQMALVLALECAHLLVEALSLVFSRYYALNMLLNLGIALFQVFLKTGDIILGELIFLLEPGDALVAFFDMGLKILNAFAFVMKLIFELSEADEKVGHRWK